MQDLAFIKTFLIAFRSLPDYDYVNQSPKFWDIFLKYISKSSIQKQIYRKKLLQQKRAAFWRNQLETSINSTTHKTLNLWWYFKTIQVCFSSNEMKHFLTSPHTHSMSAVSFCKSTIKYLRVSTIYFQDLTGNIHCWQSETWKSVWYSHYKQYMVIYDYPYSTIQSLINEPLNTVQVTSEHPVNTRACCRC